MLTLENCRDPAGDIQEYQMFCLIADKIEADPSLLSKPMETVTRWLAKGDRATSQFSKWQQILANAMASPSGLSTLLTLLRDDSEDVRFLKGFDPFPGILTVAERRQFLWTSRH